MSCDDCGQEVCLQHLDGVYCPENEFNETREPSRSSNGCLDLVYDDLLTLPEKLQSIYCDLIQAHPGGSQTPAVCSLSRQHRHPLAKTNLPTDGGPHTAYSRREAKLKGASNQVNAMGINYQYHPNPTLQ